jgi:S-formylglutathione hydrolase FrmB
MKKITTALFLLITLCSFAGTVDTLEIQSQYLKKSTKIVVIQPNPSNQVSEKYPVIYLLHGYGGNYAYWSNVSTQLSKTADDLKMIFVCPDGGKGSWYFDSPIDSSIRYESYITKELVPYIDANFATKGTIQSRAITGLSMGGHGAMYLAIRHPELFGAAGSISGGVDFRPFPKNWDIKLALGEYANNPELWYENTVLRQVELLKNNQLAIIIDCGLDDFFLPVNRSLHEKLQKLKINHDYIERPGFHNSAYWSGNVDFQILFFKKFFSKK